MKLQCAAVLLAFVALVTAQPLGKALQKTIVDRHNAARRETKGADVSEIHWSPALAQAAANWVNHCQWEHEPGQKTGENLAEVTAGHETPAKMVEAGLKMWYNEKTKYTYGNQNSGAGHYTQMIWSTTTQVGCALKSCPGNKMMMSCKYLPPGNFVNHNPYTKGAVCSKCPAGKHCSNGLCA